MGWEDGKYSCHYLRLGLFDGNVSWSTTRGRAWEVEFSGARLASSFEDLAEAKSACEKLARKKLTDALAALDKIDASAIERKGKR